MNLEITGARLEVCRPSCLTLRPRAANREESLAGGQLICSVQLAAGPPQLLRSPCVPLLGPAVSGCLHLSPESIDSRSGQAPWHWVAPALPGQKASNNKQRDGEAPSWTHWQTDKPFCAQICKTRTPIRVTVSVQGDNLPVVLSPAPAP